jgi:hypothetical protein
LCLLFLIGSGRSGLTFGLILLALGVFAQAVALLSVWF